jgi:tetratricopeptide (TPR) repeat protein
MAEVQWDEGEYTATEKSLERALEHARKAKSDREEAKILSWLFSVMFWSPTHAEEALERCESLGATRQGDQLVEAKRLTILAGLHGLRGNFDKARELFAESRDVQRELGQNVSIAAGTQLSGIVELLAGDPAAAERELRAGYDELERIGHEGYLTTVAAFLARALNEQDRLDEAERFLEISEEKASSDDLTTLADCAAVRAKVLARRGEFDRAEEMARRAVASFADTEESQHHADALVDLADVLSLAGRGEEAVPLMNEAEALYESKGVTPSLERVRAWLRSRRQTP